MASIQMQGGEAIVVQRDEFLDINYILQHQQQQEKRSQYL
jgi:hypothetical protein